MRIEHHGRSSEKDAAQSRKGRKEKQRILAQLFFEGMRPARRALGHVLIVIVLLALLPAPLHAQESQPTVNITWPNEGETLYAGPTSLLYSVPVKGHVNGLGPGTGGQQVRLLVIQAGLVHAEQIQSIDDQGAFTFFVTVNPGASEGRFPTEQSGCIAGCHFPTNTDLPAGEVTLQVELLEPPAAGAAYTTRHITVDRSGYASVPVQVVAAGEPGTPIPGVHVAAVTRLYLWRARHALAATDEQGLATLQLEALRESPTVYQLEVEPTVVDGTLYTGVAAALPAALTLAPGADSAPMVTLQVTGARGQITGKLSPAGAEPLPHVLWAICLPDGESFPAALAGDAVFAFNDIPVDRYRFATDPPWPALQDADQLDLAQDPRVEIELRLAPTEGATMAGQVLDESGAPLPFALAQIQNTRAGQWPLPADGSVFLTGLSPVESTLIVSAPGYYSSAQRVQPAVGAPGSPADTFSVALHPHPETEFMPWGSGTIVLPDDSQIETLSDELLSLQYGWLWGQNLTDELLTIRLGRLAISLQQAQFALEYLPESRGWLYLMAGEATIVAEQGESVTVSGGQMVNLLNAEGLKPVAYQPAVVRALQQDNQRQLLPSWQPSVSEQIGNRLALIGIGAAQLITFVTYFMLLLSILLLPLAILYFRRRKSISLPRPGRFL